jgi:type III pantothenate kinase
MSPFPLIAVDIGNARSKYGLFRGDCPDFRAAKMGLSPSEMPEPETTLSLPGDVGGWEQLAAWLRQIGAGQLWWWIGSVNRPATTRLLDWQRERRPADPVTLLAAGDLPLQVALERPDMVGVDRLLDAVAANRLRPPGRPAVVVDVGTAITVDLVSSDGVFSGGAILPGIAMSARALHEFTDLLPLVELEELETCEKMGTGSEPSRQAADDSRSGEVPVPIFLPRALPPALGTSTVEAIGSGLFWGAVGGIRELIRQFREGAQREPQVFVTGGAGPAVAALLGPAARHVPHLTLAGIALAAGASQRPANP